MSKRKQNTADDDADDSDVSLVDVDFEFFDLNPDVDYHALRRLSTQLFQADAEGLEAQDLAELILSQPAVGTTIKCDGKESDPYAVLTVLNLHAHQDRPCIKALIKYVLSKAQPNKDLHSVLQNLFSPAGLQSSQNVGFVFSERLINMPVQVVPPMYRMLAEEMERAIEDNQPFRFTHFLFVSRTYRLTAEEAAELYANAPRSKRQKGASAPSAGGTYSFHAEDEYVQQFASHTVDFSYTNSQPREQDSFGLDMGGRMMLVPADRLLQLVAVLNETFAPP